MRLMEAQSLVLTVLAGRKIQTAEVEGVLTAEAAVPPQHPPQHPHLHNSRQTMLPVVQRQQVTISGHLRHRPVVQQAVMAHRPVIQHQWAVVRRRKSSLKRPWKLWRSGSTLQVLKAYLDGPPSMASTFLSSSEKIRNLSA